MRARPRRETPQLDTATPDGPAHESPTPRASPAPGTVLTPGDRIAERVGRRPARHRTRASTSSQESMRVVHTPARSPGQSPDPRPDGIDSALSPIARRPQHLRAACLGDPIVAVAMPSAGDPASSVDPHDPRAGSAMSGPSRSRSPASCSAASFLSVDPRSRPAATPVARPATDRRPRLAIGGPVGDGGDRVRSTSCPRTTRIRPTRRRTRRPHVLPPADDAAVVDDRLRLEHVDDGAAVTPPLAARHDRRGSVPRRRHPAQARRGRHRRRRRQRPGRDVQGQGRRHARRHRPEVRRLDDDPVVGQQAQGQGRPHARPGARDPAGQRSRRRGQAEPTRSPSLATALQGRRGRDPQDERDRRPQPRRRPGARPAGRQGRADPDPEARPKKPTVKRHCRAQRRQRRQPADRSRPPKTYPAATSPGRPRAATSASTTTTATTASTSTAAPATAIVAAAGGTVTFAGWKSNGGGYQVWIAHGSGLYTTYNHMSSVSVGRGQHVGQGPARRPHGRDRLRHAARTSTSRSGGARSGTAARASTRSPTSRPSPHRVRRSSDRSRPGRVRECPRCSSTA